jgi:hypothetical protein
MKNIIGIVVVAFLMALSTYAADQSNDVGDKIEKAQSLLKSLQPRGMMTDEMEGRIELFNQMFPQIPVVNNYVIEQQAKDRFILKMTVNLSLKDIEAIISTLEMTHYQPKAPTEEPTE